jgi:hypothetical protein
VPDGQFITVYQIAETEKPASTYKPQTMLKLVKKLLFGFPSRVKNKLTTNDLSTALKNLVAIRILLLKMCQIS